MKNIALCLFAVLLSVIVPPAHAENWELTLWGASHHLASPPKDREWNESNPGIGIRYYLRDIYGFQTYLEADYITKNSTGGSLMQAGVGAHYPFRITTTLSLFAGGAVGIARYENAWDARTVVSPGGYPYVGAQYQDITVMLGYLPETNQTYQAFFAVVGFRF